MATMDEASFQRMQAAVVASQNINSSPSKSSERLIDGRKTPDFEFYSQIFPPELARQIMMGKLFCLIDCLFWGSVMRVGSDTFGDPIFQKGLQN